MVCLFLLPVIAKITTDCLILIGCWKVSLNLIGCLKKLSRRTKWSTPLDWGGSGLYVGASKKFVPFFGLTLSPDKVCMFRSSDPLLKDIICNIISRWSSWFVSLTSSGVPQKRHQRKLHLAGKRRNRPPLATPPLRRPLMTTRSGH